MLRKIGKALFTFLNFILYRVEIVHREKLPDHGPAIIVSNHQHIFDVSVIHCSTRPWIYWVTKREIIETPIIGYLAKKMGVLPVDRHKNDLSVAKNIFRELKNKKIIGIFPQGTRIKSPEQVSKVVPKTGAVHFALKTNTPIIPIGLSSTFKLFSTIRVVVGDPIDFSCVPESTPGKTLLMKQTIYMMSQIYHLVGIEYAIDENILDSEIKG
jgi:1-acyl-sn-glycerol-3-phosphate acyltransferase